MAGTGAFLLVVAAALFVSVRWDDLTQLGKLGVIALATSSCLTAGHVTRRSLPSTSAVLTHLGAFLVPVDAAAVGLHLGLGWEWLLVLEGAVGTLTFGGLWRSTRSRVLAVATVAAIATTAAGVGAVGPVAAPTVLAAVAVAVMLVRHDAAKVVSVALAAVAGVAPLVGQSLADLLPVTADVLVDIGVAGGPQLQWAVVSGVLAAVVLGRRAHVDGRVDLAAIAVLTALAGGAVAFASTETSEAADTLIAPSLLVAAQAAALVWRRTPVWAPVLRFAALVARVAGFVAAATAAVYLAAYPLTEVVLDIDAIDADRVVAGAFALVAVAWMLDGIRMRLDATPDTGEVTWRTLVPIAGSLDAVPLALSVMATAVLSTGRPAAGAVTGLVYAAGLVAASVKTPAGAAVAVVGLVAPLLTVTSPAAALAAAIAGTALCAVCTRAAAADRRWTVVPLAGSAVATALLGGLIARDDLGSAALVVVVAALWGVARPIDRFRPDVAVGVRAATLATLVVAAPLSSADLLVTALAVVAVSVADGLRLDSMESTLPAALAVHIAVVAVADVAGLDIAATGLALCVAGLVWTGLTGLAAATFRTPLWLAAGIGLATGLLLATVDGRTLADAVVVAGAAVITGGLLHRLPEVAHVGGVVTTIGIAAHLALDGVTAVEAYAAPVALHLLVIGYVARRLDPTLSTWKAYVPGLLVFGGTALAARLLGGDGDHAVWAGATGVVALVVGGARRLAGPQYTGIGLLVAVAVHESLGTLATVPTWAWLAGAGATLLAAGVVLERTESPAVLRRRLVDALRDG